MDKMKTKRMRYIIDPAITLGVLFLCFCVGLVMHGIFNMAALVPLIFILGTFLISVVTDGYIYGVLSAVIGMLAVNFAFTFPFFKFNFTLPVNWGSAIVLIIVALITSALTTKLKRQEAIKAESEREKMIANLLRAVSHDLRTPLTTIYGSSSAMLENGDEFTDEQKTKMLKGIKEDAQWLVRIVENLLSVSKLDNGNVKIIKSPVVLDELVDSVLVKFNKRYPEYEVAVDIPDDFVVIPMDGILIEQVAINILENAVHHAKGMTELSMKVFVISNKAVFEISDNGCGIEKERLKTIFTGYYTSDESPVDGQSANTGIGLSVCATIIKAHGGDIKAENLKTGGAMFRFTLDMEDLENE